MDRIELAVIQFFFLTSIFPGWKHSCLMERYGCSVVSVWSLTSAWWCLRSEEVEAGVCTYLYFCVHKFNNQRERRKADTAVTLVLNIDLNDIHFSWRLYGNFPAMGWTPWRCLTMIVQIGSHPTLLPQAPTTGLQVQGAFVDLCWPPLGNSSLVKEAHSRASGKPYISPKPS